MAKLKSQEWTAAGSTTWTVPTGVKLVWATVLGGGGGGERDLNAAASGGPGGGAGEFVSQMPLAVTPGGSIAVTVGAAGAKGFYANHTAPSGGSIATIGGSSNFGPFIALGGGIFEVSGVAATPVAGYGGGVNGGLRGNSTTPIYAETIAAADGSRWYGGGGGGARCDPSVTPGATGMNGGPAGGRLFGGTGGAISGSPSIPGPGGGGAATVYGVGGNGGDDFTDGNVASIRGTGGGGAGGTSAALGVGPFHDGGAGAPGYVAVFWIEP